DQTKQALFAIDQSLQELPKARLRTIIANYLDNLRQKIRLGQIKSAEELALAKHLPNLLRLLREALEPKFKRVLNATGVVIHTNLGRSVLCEEACKAVSLAASGYNSLELDLATGKRGSRYALVEDLLCQITGAEAAMVVNNNAAAVLLMLDTFCQGQEVIVSRGELVEIGGSFRIPEVMRRSGAYLREIGTTNRTHLSDYALAISDKTRAIMRVHTSNFRVLGFHKSVELKELSALARSKQLLLLEDLGSGSLVNLSQAGLPAEPTVQEVVAQGVDLVSFSGDKVLGGPQAGIIVGRAELIRECKSNQLTRALRCDKLCLAALAATLRLYLKPEEAMAKIPTLRNILCSKSELQEKAEILAAKLNAAFGTPSFQVVSGNSRVGGGAFPEYDLPTSLVELKPSPELNLLELKAALLKTDPPLILRLEQDKLLLDPRTLPYEDFDLVVKVLVLAREALISKDQQA
ncbi:MAG: L-seryl-tRNA(Sec) selenium transferase, partial [Desulfovibrio sp.]|nr:L-seryl-tRNA(Sec) selenium transferase [Desulfovibrio sp.]